MTLGSSGVPAPTGQQPEGTAMNEMNVASGARASGVVDTIEFKNRGAGRPAAPSTRHPNS